MRMKKSGLQGSDFAARGQVLHGGLRAEQHPLLRGTRPTLRRRHPPPPRPIGPATLRVFSRHGCHLDAAMVQKAPLKIYVRGVVSYFNFSRAPRARALKIRQINSAILKVPDAAWIR
jgi:hypothetical protein